MGYANSISSDEITTSAQCCSRVQHAQCDIAELRLSAAADIAVASLLDECESLGETSPPSTFRCADFSATLADTSGISPDGRR
jgi:hypothetical protein